MYITDALQHYFPTQYEYVSQVMTLLQERVNDLWNHVIYAYSAGSLPKTELPLHPSSNPYPRSYKTTPWPLNLDLAAVSNEEEIPLQSDALEQVSPLHAAVYGNNIKAIYRLIRDKADVNACDFRGQSPAYWAAYYGNLQALMILASYGAKLGSPDLRGKTPLRAAAKYGHESIITFLMLQKVNPNLKDGRGLTPLHIAA